MYSTTNRTLYGIMALAVLGISAFILFEALIAHAEGAPTVTTEIHTGAHATVTSAPIGTDVHAFVTVASTTSSTTPTGTVDFNLFGNTSCAGSAAVQSGVALVNGTAQSGTTTLSASGLSFKVHYSGDASTTPADGSCAALATTSAVVATTTPNHHGGDDKEHTFKHFLKKSLKFTNGHDNGKHLGQLKHHNKGKGHDNSDQDANENNGENDD